MLAPMRVPDDYLEGKARILDLGGWFKPEPRATHVVDYLPWETRGTKLNLQPLPGERFSKATWFQADFIDPNLRLPFPDKFFDVVLCGHTVEDLTAPQHLLREMQRVGIAGVIEVPSRLIEQTLGSRDRRSRLPGHPHHHWIADVSDGELVLSAKPDSGLASSAQVVPLSYFEAVRRTRPGADVTIHAWSGQLRFRFAPRQESADRARQFVRGLGISRLERLTDGGRRWARRLRARWRGQAREDFSWWPRILEESRPYSAIPLR